MTTADPLAAMGVGGAGPGESCSRNFSPGPALLPKPVRERIEDHFASSPGGMSIVEISHRSPGYEEIHHRALARCRALYWIPDDIEVLLLGGGASQQFAMVPMNLLRPGHSADYIDTGSWSRKAEAEAARLGRKTRIAASSADRGYSYIPEQGSLRLDAGAEYLHLTSNNTIAGTQYRGFPDSGEVPLAVDLTSDLLARPVAWERVGVAYGGTQKNAGIAGCTLVFLRRDLLSREEDSIPAIFRYSTHAGTDSLYNTPPVFAVFVLDLVLGWLEDSGGLEAVGKRNESKARILYEVIDGHPAYRGLAETASRSAMNVTFDLADPQLRSRFAAAAQQQGFVGLQGHRSVGGLRASLYNGMTEDGCLALADFMRDFAAGL
ncbi:MAG: 3-phosphoserine/phosphohydroxythreonine transaminase [Gemmatimonadetes bacterium]|nr:3-phosphoserine/phosphohydroxythreonine transaminase [Gemmatimonadota bacterium]